MKLRDLHKFSDRDLIAELRLTETGLTGDESSFNLNPLRGGVGDGYQRV